MNPPARLRAAAPWLAATFAYAAAIFGMSSAPRHIALWSALDGIDKLAHAAEFAIFAALVHTTARRAWSEGSTFDHWLWASCVATVYGALDEIHQAYVPGRSASFYDFLFDALGAACACTALAAAAHARADPEHAPSTDAPPRSRAWAGDASSPIHRLSNVARALHGGSDARGHNERRWSHEERA